MKKSLKLVLTVLSAVVILFFMITLVNQLFGIVDIVARYNETASQAVFVVFSILLLGLLIAPLYYIIRLPARLDYPTDGDVREIDRYKKKLAARLNKNKYIKAAEFQVDENNLEEAFLILEKEARKEVNRGAAIVFVSTAISQSGKLDSFVVLALLIKMVWRVAHIYNQRPAISNLVRLYANVAGTTLIAANLEEIDMSEQMEPVIAEMIGSTALGVVPGFSQITTFGFSCVMEGSVNAFLALRMGEVAIGYSGSITKPERSLIRKSASIKALGSLRTIVSDNGKEVLKALFNASKKRFTWSGKPKPADADGELIKKEAKIPPKEQQRIIDRVLSIWYGNPRELKGTKEQGSE
ncbi:MAG: YcjF family protein [Balneolia bacterium]|nr:YcjF family protein [Balneolia bacterium]